jgi:hypothetical protein
MECLHCGDCCLRMSPVSAPDPCPYLTKEENFYFCGIYKSRPKECRDHAYPSRFCPIGLDLLKLDDPIRVSMRIDDGWNRTQSSVS